MCFYKAGERKAALEGSRVESKGKAGEAGVDEAGKCGCSLPVMEFGLVLKNGWILLSAPPPHPPPCPNMLSLDPQTRGSPLMWSFSFS